MAADDGQEELRSLGRHLGKNYEFLGLIARGGMGAVYKARHIPLDRHVAIKVLTPHIIAMLEEAGFPVSERFEVEARAMASLVHQHIVGVHDFGQTDDGYHYIVMEYVDGESIEGLLKQARLEEDNVLIIARQICRALAYSHGRGMVHRDIKPGNILIDRNGMAKVTDFGLVKVMGSDRFNTQVGFGTPGYFAPEIVNGESDERSDIYSFGVLLYQLLTGELPAGAWEPVSAIRPDLDGRFDEIVETCLRRKPEDRFQSMEEVKDALDAIAFHAPDGRTGQDAIERGALLRRLAIIYLSLFVVSGIVSLFDIYFNRSHIGWILEQAKEGQREVFDAIITRCNLVSYFVLPAAWAWIVFGLVRRDPRQEETRRYLVNIPWWGAGLCALGWFGSIPGIFLQMPADFVLPASAMILLPVSILVKSGISILMGFLLTDILTQRLLYRHYFSRNESPAAVVGDRGLLGLETRGVFWIVSSSVCPILALLLLVLSVISFDPGTFALYKEDVGKGSAILFTSIVALVSLGVVLAGVFTFRLLVVQPVRELREAANRIREGDYDVRVETCRADEFGELARDFNRMAAGLREREHLRELVDEGATGKVARDLTQPRL